MPVNLRNSNSVEQPAQLPQIHAIPVETNHIIYNTLKLNTQFTYQCLVNPKLMFMFNLHVKFGYVSQVQSLVRTLIFSLFM